MVLEKTLESPLDCKGIKPVYPKGNQSWIFIGRTDAEADTPILWDLMQRVDSLEKDSDAGKDWRQEEKGMTEDEMVGWHHRVDGHEFEQTLRVGNEHGSLECCSPWGCKESENDWVINWTESSGPISITLGSKRGFADMIKLSILRSDYTGSPGGRDIISRVHQRGPGGFELLVGQLTTRGRNDSSKGWAFRLRWVQSWEGTEEILFEPSAVQAWF